MKEKRPFLCISVVYRQTWVSLAYNVTVFCLYCSWLWIICYFHSSPLQQWFVKTHTGFHCYVCFQATASYLYLGFREQVRGTLSDPVSRYGVVDLIIYPFLMASLTTQSVHQSVFFSATSQEFQSIWKALGLATRCYFQRNCETFFFFLLEKHRKFLQEKWGDDKRLDRAFLLPGANGATNPRC